LQRDDESLDVEHRVSLHIGNHAGRYSIKEVIGRGTTSTVFLGEHLKLGHEAAVKVLFPHLACHGATAERFRAAACAAAQTEHPGIVKVLDVGDLDDGVPYYVMELLRGRPLDRGLAKHLPLSPEQAYVLVKQICGALTAIHDGGQAHLGLRPSNVFVTGQSPWRVKLLSPGVTVVEDCGQDSSAVEARLEACHFTTPEQAAKQLEELSSRTDIYSLGALVYWMLTGRAPLEGQPDAILERKAQSPPPALRAVRPDVSDDLSELITRCLQRRPRDRPRTAEEVAFLFGKSVQMTVEELESRVKDVISAVLKKGGGEDQEAVAGAPERPASKDAQPEDVAKINEVLRRQRARSANGGGVEPGDGQRVDLPGPVDEAALREAEEAAQGVVARADPSAPMPVQPGDIHITGEELPTSLHRPAGVPDDDDAPTDEVPARSEPDAGADRTPVAPSPPKEPETMLRTHVVAAEDIVSAKDLKHRPDTAVHAVDELVAAGDLDDAGAARGGSHRRYVLRVQEGPDAGLEQALEVGTVLVGTHRDNDLVLADPTISRNHLEIQIRTRDILVSDLDTSNGTFLGERSISRAVVHGRVRLRVGRDTVIELIPVDR